MADYPKREAFFAYRYTRLLFRVCVAQELGCEAAVLLICVAHTEDAKKYRAPVTYWNHQLESILGMSWGRLDRARRKAIEAGWLHYERGPNRTVGRYWVTIPECYLGMDDHPTDEDLFLQNGEITGEQTGNNRGITGEQTGNNRGITMDPSSLFCSKPIPKKKSLLFDPLKVLLPEELDTPDFRETWQDWIAHRSEIQKPLTATSTRQQMRRFSEWGAGRAVEAMRHTIANGWVGIREPEGNGRLAAHEIVQVKERDA